MRPRRIARRFIARAKNWGIPHVHCPGCGADNPVPDDAAVRTCFTCHIDWFRYDLTGDDAADFSALRERADGAGVGAWAMTWRPLLVDAPAPGGGKRTVQLPCAFVYQLRG